MVRNMILRRYPMHDVKSAEEIWDEIGHLTFADAAIVILTDWRKDIEARQRHLCWMAVTTFWQDPKSIVLFEGIMKAILSALPEEESDEMG
jgi:hypothetical protein